MKVGYEVLRNTFANVRDFRTRTLPHLQLSPNENRPAQMHSIRPRLVPVHSKVFTRVTGLIRQAGANNTNFVYHVVSLHMISFASFFLYPTLLFNCRFMRQPPSSTQPPSFLTGSIFNVYMSQVLRIAPAIHSIISSHMIFNGLNHLKSH
jgi:hypothetical protein